MHETNNKETPLIYDLDGTLIYNDVTVELCVLHFKTANIYGFLQICFWLFHGKNYLKQKLAEEYLKDFEVENLPFSRVTEELELDHFNNKFIVSGSHQSIVDKINQNLKIGNKAFGSGLNGNLVGERKAKFIMDKFGPDFAYVGNSMADIPIWKKSSPRMRTMLQPLQLNLQKGTVLNLRKLSYDQIISLMS